MNNPGMSSMLNRRGAVRWFKKTILLLLNSLPDFYVYEFLMRDDKPVNSLCETFRATLGI
jgi:hypothetical protein